MLAGVATQEQAEQFSYGDCWILALQINERDPSWRLAANGEENHAFCVRQDDEGEWWALDVNGAQPLEDLLTDWGFHRSDEPWKFVTDETFTEWMAPGGNGEMYCSSWEVAPQLALDLIEEAETLMRNA